MRVVIDMQGLQTESRFRGIGRYTLSFVRAVVRNRGDVEIVLALSDLFPDTIDEIRSAFSDHLPPSAIRIWSSEGPIRECDAGNVERRENAELVREAFLASLRPDVIHVTSLFEGFVDDAVTSIGTLDSVSPVTVALYDLIPLANQAQYLDHNADYRAHYLRKVEWLRRASGFLAISEFSRAEGRDVLQMDDALFHDVSTAIEADFAQVDVSDEASASMLEALCIDKPFVLYTGGSDGRKNLRRLIEAFARASEAFQSPCQLVLAGRMPESDIVDLRRHAASSGVAEGDLVFTGYISDTQLVTLYRRCACFAFASWHEGFGLPALEAMACGAPVIGAATSSIVEVIDLPEALFDPFDIQDIADRLLAVLTDADFAARLRAHGLKQAQRFSWDRTACRAIDVWREIAMKHPRDVARAQHPGAKRRMAMVTPLPPERSGIADYSADLLSELSRFYEIDVILDQESVDPVMPQGVSTRDMQWFRGNAASYDRIVYQMGNSPFHRHVPDLMRDHPGVLVLHDFFLSSLMAWLEEAGGSPDAWSRALYLSHGLRAAARRQIEPGAAKHDFPSSYELVSEALGVIVHSGYARGLLEGWYGKTRDVSVIPLLKQVEWGDGRTGARETLGLPDDAFVVCSFGFLDPSKLNHLLLEAWEAAGFSQDAQCHLVFVGENHGGEYGAALKREIESLRSRQRVRITGFVDAATYRLYLQSADMAVQMRAASRGETSAAVMDCLSRGVPLVVNANGSLAEVYSEGAIVLDDDLKVDELASAMLRLRNDAALRQHMSQGGRSAIERFHRPDVCAERYRDVIEAAYAFSPAILQSKLYGHLRQRTAGWTLQRLKALSRDLAQTFPEQGSAPRLLLDLTATVSTDLHTGIERVARGILAALLRQESPGLRIEPVYLDSTSGSPEYRHARDYALRVQGALPIAGLGDDLVDPRPGDVLLTLDISGAAFVSAVRAGLLARFRKAGVRAYAMLFDLLPIRMPEVFPPGADDGHRMWLESVVTLDGAVCISRAVADDMRAWLDEVEIDPDRRFELFVSHLGFDIDASTPTTGLPDDSAGVLSAMRTRPSILMVGSIEPRKGYLQALTAFSELWDDGADVNLVIVGREGWRGLDSQARRDIPATIEKLHAHPERGNRLHWLSEASDEYLGRVYDEAACLLAASYGEGFGLPLIEAAGHGLPLLVRDIPVFREVAGSRASYFQADSAGQLASAVRHWLALHGQNLHPSSAGLARITWDEMAASIKQMLMKASAENGGIKK